MATELATRNIEDTISAENLHKVIELLTAIRYGAITLVIQDGKVVQIDKLEKIRFK